MSEVVKVLGIEDVDTIVDKITVRQETFLGEDLRMSVGVVLLNYGDGLVEVVCVNREWTGAKKDLTPRDGIPLCPNGHPLFEISEAPKLALIKEHG